MSDLQANIPDVAVMKGIPDDDFARTVVMALAAYDLKAPGFNFIARNNLVTPIKDRLYFYPEEHKPFIGASLNVAREFDETGKVSQATRDGYIREFTKDTLRRLETDKESQEYKTFCENVTSFVEERLAEANAEAKKPPQKPMPTVSTSWTQKL
ncbi:MAG: hypothetical protein GC185_02465 [Alphaproteobacteria bacterium]|nr:hypothetical protein [Alphaproteobacteria bacterium]